MKKLALVLLGLVFAVPSWAADSINISPLLMSGPTISGPYSGTDYAVVLRSGLKAKVSMNAFATLGDAQTFSNKTLASPIINGGILNSGVLGGSFTGNTSFTGTITVNTLGGNPIFPGVPQFTQALAGTQIWCLGLDSGLNLVKSTGACGTGGGGGGTSALTNAHVFVGNAGNTATDVAVSGDITMANTGAVSVTRVNGATLGPATPTSGNVLVGSGSQWATQAISGDATLAAGGALTVGNNAISNAKAAQMAAHRIKGNNTGSTANPIDLTGTQVTAELDPVVGDSGAGGTKGLVPAPAAGDTAAGKFLKADGSYAVPPGTNGCPSTATSWDGTSNLTVGASTGLVYTTGSTPVAAGRTLTLPTIASYTIGCELRIVDLAGIFNATNVVTPTRQSSDTIDGATTATTLGIANQSVAYAAIATAKWGTQEPPSLGSVAAVSHKWINSIPPTGIPTQTQPDFSDLTGAATGAQMLALPSGDLYVGNGSNVPAAVALSGDATIASTGAITVSKTSGSSFAASATTDTTNAANITTGNLSVNRLNSGSGASNSTFWAGDGTWRTPAGGGGGGVSASAIQQPPTYSYVNYSPGLLAAVNSNKLVLHHTVIRSMIDRLTGSAITFTCSVNPQITFYACTDTTCSSSPTTLGTVTVTANATATEGTISSEIVPQNSYIAAAMTAGTCSSVNLAGALSLHSLPGSCGYADAAFVTACNSNLIAALL